jgi:hypothetical protein
MRRLVTAGLLLIITIVIDGTGLSKKFRWCVYYSDKAPIQSFYEFDLLVFDSNHHPQLSPLAGPPSWFAMSGWPAQEVLRLMRGSLQAARG